MFLTRFDTNVNTYGARVEFLFFDTFWHAGGVNNFLTRIPGLPPAGTRFGSARKAKSSWISMFMRAGPPLPGFALITAWSSGFSQIGVDRGLNGWPWNDQEGNRWTIDATLVWAGHVFLVVMVLKTLIQDDQTQSEQAQWAFTNSVTSRVVAVYKPWVLDLAPKFIILPDCSFLSSLEGAQTM